MYSTFDYNPDDKEYLVASIRLPGDTGVHPIHIKAVRMSGQKFALHIDGKAVEQFNSLEEALLRSVTLAYEHARAMFDRLFPIA